MLNLGPVFAAGCMKLLSISACCKHTDDGRAPCCCSASLPKQLLHSTAALTSSPHLHGIVADEAPQRVIVNDAAIYCDEYQEPAVRHGRTSNLMDDHYASLQSVAAPAARLEATDACTECLLASATACAAPHAVPAALLLPWCTALVSFAC